MIGKTVSHYRIVGALGAGGMGVVYAGEDVRLGRPVALKFVPEDLAKDRQAVERLNSEARTTSGLNHPNICTIYDIGTYEGQPFIVMERLQGQTLRDRLSTASLKTLDVIDLGIQVADALDAAHRRDVIHRDIKPANIFLVDRGPVKVLDFGLAKLLSQQREASTTVGSTREHTAEGVTLGTVSYMSPEQVTGENLDGRTDLFSLGVVLYEALTGHQPFTGKTSAVVFSAILTHAPVAPIVLNPTLPLRLQEIVNNCLEKDPELRYQDAAGLRADLRRIKRDLESGRSGVFRVSGSSTLGTDLSRGAPTNTTVSSDGAPATRVFRRTAKGAYVAIAAIVIAAVALVAGMYYRTLPRERPAPESAAAPSASFVRTQLALAAASIESKDYRAALVYAGEVLRVSPDDKDATRIRDAARASLARFDEAIARADRRLAAGDTVGATDALNAARAIDPSAAAVGEVSARIAGQVQSAERARRDAPSSKSAAASQQPAASEPPRPVAGQRPAPDPTASVPAPAASAPAPAPAPVAPPVVPPPQPAPSRAAPTTREASEPRENPAAAPPAVPAPAPRAETPERREAPVAPPVAPESDDAMIRRVVATYARAIETKDLALFRSVKPNLSSDEQRRIEQGFRAVVSQQVSASVISIEQRGSDASVRVRRRDTIQAGGREQTTESMQTMTLTRTASGWVIKEIGR